MLLLFAATAAVVAEGAVAAEDAVAAAAFCLLVLMHVSM